MIRTAVKKKFLKRYIIFACKDVSYVSYVSKLTVVLLKDVGKF